MRSVPDNQVLGPGQRMVSRIICKKSRRETSNLSPAAESQSKTNLNLASSKELQKLPGVGKVIAERIIAGRPWRDVESIRRINGVGDMAMMNLKPRVTVIYPNAPKGTADFYRKNESTFLNRFVDVQIKMVVDVNWPAPDGFVVLQAITAVGNEPGGAIPIFFPKEKLEDVLRFYGEGDAVGKTRALFYRYNGELVLVKPRSPEK